jgi:hypothetical protein
MGEDPLLAKWRLIPALTFAGVVSAVFTGFIRWPSTYEVRANVTVFPNEQWARYEVDVPPLTRQARYIQVLRRFGNNLYQEGPYFFWSSGDFVVDLDCQGVGPEVINEFLNAYLQKFPSNV